MAAAPSGVDHLLGRVQHAVSWAEASSALRQLIRQHWPSTSSADACLHLAQRHQASGRHRLALRYLDRLKGHPREKYAAQAHYLASKSLVALNDETGAIVVLQQLIRLYPKCLHTAIAAKWLVQLFLDRGDRRRAVRAQEARFVALEACRRRLGRSPLAVDVCIELAYDYAAVKALDLATTRARQAERLISRMPQGTIGLTAAKRAIQAFYTSQNI